MNNKGHNITSSIMITITPLDVYKCEKDIKDDKNGRKWILVGDAAFAVPYFRGLNNGSLLARKVVESLSPGINIYKFLPMTIANNLYRTAKRDFLKKIQFMSINTRLCYFLHMKLVK